MWTGEVVANTQSKLVYRLPHTLRCACCLSCAYLCDLCSLLGFHVFCRLRKDNLEQYGENY